MSALAEKISIQIINAIDSDKLILPTLPEIALRVREVADDANATIKQLMEVISNDAALAARVIKVANSPLFRAAREIEDLQMALSRLGMQYTCNLATGLAMEQMFQATSDIVDRRLREVWSRSSEIAGICHVLCKHRTKLRPDQAALAGLVHQIGVLPILSFAEDNPSILRDSFSLDEVITAAHPKLGVKILTSWDFPKELRQIPEDYMLFEKEKPTADYADLVTVAALQSHAGTLSTLANVDYHNVKAFERLGLDPDLEAAEAENLSEEMETAMALLK